MIILASASPRRRELLKKYGIKFEIMVTDVDEKVSVELSPEEYVLAVAARKAEAAVGALRKKVCNGDVIIAADTIVSIDGRILGKPNNRNDAFSMLKLLEGSWHIVYTGICVALFDGSVKYVRDCCATRVKFKPVTDAQINEYLNTDEPYDKAGAYAIQGEGAKLIERIEGDYNNVVGLPVGRLLEMLTENGVR